VEVRYLVEKWNICCAHLHEIIGSNMQFGIDFCVFTCMFTCKQKISNFWLFFKINTNVWLLCALFVMTSVISIIEDLTVNKMYVMHLVFMFQMIFFSHFRSWKARYSLRSISYPEGFTTGVHVLGGRKSGKELK
jgi:hypothetical protein